MTRKGCSSVVQLRLRGDDESTQIVANAALGEGVLRLPQWPRSGRAAGPGGATMSDANRQAGPAAGAPRIRAMSAEDVPLLLELIDALADYEHLPRPDDAARERLARDAVAEPPRFRAFLAEVGGTVVGYALYFETYSTFLARPTLYLEDLFVRPDARSEEH